MGRNKKVRVLMAIDFGGSGTKIIFSLLGGEPQTAFMEPEIGKVSSQSVKEIQTSSNLETADPENVAWVGVGRECFAVGYLASSRYYANPGLSVPKYELATVKTLAAVWLICIRLQLPDSFTLSLACLLPPGEFNDAELFQAQLKEALAEFETPTGIMKIDLAECRCFPEGGGIYMMYGKKSGVALRSSVGAIVMLGYRNASVLVSRRGVMGGLATSNMGMVRLAEMVVQRTSGLSAIAISSAIAIAGDDPKPSHFFKLLKSSSSDHRKKEADRIIEAIALSRSEYATALTSWLKEVLPPHGELDWVVNSGGTADYPSSVTLRIKLII